MKTRISRTLPALVLLLAVTASAQVPDTLQHSIPAPPTGAESGGELGRSVAVDGVYTVAGAPYDNLLGSDSGVVKVFNSNTGALLYVLPNPTPAVGDNFGISVAVSGTRVVIGAQLDDTGASERVASTARGGEVFRRTYALISPSQLA